MNQTFWETARKFAPVAAQILGWRPDEFWRATPEELALSLTDPSSAGQVVPVDRSDINRMLERENNG